MALKIIQDYALRQTHLKYIQSNYNRSTIILDARKVLLANNDCSISICSPVQRKMDYFYKNAEGDEVIYIHDGKGVLISPFGKLEIKQGDYVVIPRTVIYKLEFEEGPLRIIDCRICLAC
jgi:homogentisate 1,2-dioxygenase